MVIPFAYLALTGCRLWFTASATVPDSAHSRMFFNVEAMRFYAPTMLGLQVFDLSTTIILPGMRKPDAIAHHAVSLYLAYQLTGNGFLHYWEPFYFGMLELSSVPLCFVDFFRAFPALAKRFDAVNEVARLSFAGSFLPIRCLYMPYVSYFWWRDFLSLYADNDKTISANVGLFAMFGAINIFLVGIQQYWGYKVIKAAMKMAKGDKAGREKEY
eukprot:CAMPEP_0119407448 /NCGR_PEP_ID=MMETSP1335-20130426/1327_1 /TAXON_ID=259385 /ORGANISM="Chrysoculter rhomboideus, Strain RCC1486" /LENGTH=213 /DNA_ID=CAMNT_0007431553 /DNA_START=116 /DNA_END=757 /DNA_ORIENTATION=+